MATEILRPNAPGDECSISSQTGCSACPNHYDCVKEVVADEDATMIYETVSDRFRDLYSLPPSSGSGTINFIKIYFRTKSSGAGKTVRPSLKSNGTVTDGIDYVPLPGTWTTHSQQWNTNPADGEAWEWADIDALQIGISLEGGVANTFCTQIYVEVDYTPGWSGKIAGVTNPAKIMGVDVANIGKVKGVTSA